MAVYFRMGFSSDSSKTGQARFRRFKYSLPKLTTITLFTLMGDFRDFATAMVAIGIII